MQKRIRDFSLPQRRLTDSDFLKAEIGNERYRPITEGFDPSLPWSNSEFVACAKSGRIDLSEAGSDA